MPRYVVGDDLNSKRKEEYGPLIETIKSLANVLARPRFDMDRSN